MSDNLPSSIPIFLVRPARHHDVESVADILALSFYGYLISPTLAENPSQDLSPTTTNPSVSYQNHLSQNNLNQADHKADAASKSWLEWCLTNWAALVRYSKQMLWRLMRWGIMLDLQHRLREDSPHHAWLVVVSLNQPQQPVATLEICLRSGIVNPSYSSSFWSEILGNFWLHRSQFPYIFNVAVHPQFRRQGVARQLLHAAEKVVKGWGYGRIVMHVLETNHGARHLYGRQGYAVVGVEGKIWSWLWQQPYKLILQKSLALPDSLSRTQPRPS